jgi:hypothetical protein
MTWCGFRLRPHRHRVPPTGVAFDPLPSDWSTSPTDGGLSVATPVSVTRVRKMRGQTAPRSLRSTMRCVPVARFSVVSHVRASLGENAGARAIRRNAHLHIAPPSPVGSRTAEQVDSQSCRRGVGAARRHRRWTRLAARTSATARMQHTAIYDAGGHAMVAHGGRRRCKAPHPTMPESR